MTEKAKTNPNTENSTCKGPGVGVAGRTWDVFDGHYEQGRDNEMKRGRVQDERGGWGCLLGSPPKEC